LPNAPLRGSIERLTMEPHQRFERLSRFNHEGHEDHEGCVRPVGLLCRPDGAIGETANTSRKLKPPAVCVRGFADRAPPSAARSNNRLCDLGVLCG
jgi:hypothetical protein